MLYSTMFLDNTCVALGTHFNLLEELEPWRVVEHVNGWCCRGIYNGGIWENDLYVSAQVKLSNAVYTHAYISRLKHSCAPLRMQRRAYAIPPVSQHKFGLCVSITVALAFLPCP